MQTIRLSFFSFLFLIVVVVNVSAEQWNVLVYVEAADDLHKFAWNNINDLASSVSTNENVALHVQVHTNSNIAWRYCIKRDSVLQRDLITLTGGYKTDLIDAAHWAYDGHDTMYQSLILWGRGYGLFSPSVSEGLQPA